MKDITSLKELNSSIKQYAILVIYYSNDACSVCKVLRPKIKELLEQQFPKAGIVYVNTETHPEISGQFRVFTIPTIDIYVEGREHTRFSRNVTLHEFARVIEKPYDILLGDNSVD